MTIQVDVQLACTDDSIPAQDFIESWIIRSLDAASTIRHAEISVRIVGADEMRRLNREHRDKDRPTNVLSYPAGPVAGMPASELQPLGDIVVCAAVVADEAASQGKAVADHWAHMLVHGTLHLLGFDHIEDDEAVAMEALEARILAGHGVADPYGAAGDSC